METVIYQLWKGTYDVHDILTIYQNKHRGHSYELPGFECALMIKERMDKFLSRKTIPFDKYYSDKYRMPAYRDPNMEKMMSVTGLTSNDRNKSSSELCTYTLYSYNDIPDVYSRTVAQYQELDKQQKPFDSHNMCFTDGNLTKNTGLEFIHAKYCYKMLHGESLPNIMDKIIASRHTGDTEYAIKPNQKQAVMGMGSTTGPKFRDCRDIYSAGISSRYENIRAQMTEKVPQHYTHSFNREFIRCASFRKTLFPVRHFDNWALPYHAFTDYQLEKTKYSRFLSKCDTYVYCGIVTLKMKDLYGKDNLQYYGLWYDMQHDFFRIYDHEMINMIESIKSNTVVTFFEVQQLSTYSNLYTYTVTDGNDPSIYFSKYNIFDLNQVYDPDIYFPLTKSQFAECLEYYRKVLTPAKYFKYPSVMPIPKCLNASEVDSLKNRYTKLLSMSNGVKIQPQLNVIEYNKNNGRECKLSRHNYIR
jgi:hypothetical protein